MSIWCCFSCRNNARLWIIATRVLATFRILRRKKKFIGLPSSSSHNIHLYLRWWKLFMTPIFLHWSPFFPGETYFAVCRTCAVGVLCRDPPSWKWWVSVDPITIEVVEKLWDSSVLFVGFDAALATLASSLKDSSKRSCRCRISRSVDSRTKKPLLGSSKLISKPGDRNEIFLSFGKYVITIKKEVARPCKVDI